MSRRAAPEATPAARRLRALTWDRVAPNGSLLELERLTQVLGEEDRRFLDEAKQTLRRGVQVFESFERHTLVRGRKPLFQCVQSLPRALADYYARVSERLPATAALEAVASV